MKAEDNNRMEALAYIIADIKTAIPYPKSLFVELGKNIEVSINAQTVY